MSNPSRDKGDGKQGTLVTRVNRKPDTPREKLIQTQNPPKMGYKVYVCVWWGMDVELKTKQSRARDVSQRDILSTTKTVTNACLYAYACIHTHTYTHTHMSVKLLSIDQLELRKK